METILVLDQQFFLLLNHLPHNAVFNDVALLLSGVGTGGIVWFVLGALLILREEKKDHRFWVPLVLGGLGSWVIAELILKPIFVRPRPDISMGAIVVGLNCCGYAFPSGHATIAWAMTAVLAQKEPKWRVLLYVLAFLISLSRIYLGKHYPFDVVAGGLLGWVIGTISIRVLAIIKK